MRALAWASLLVAACARSTDYPRLQFACSATLDCADGFSCIRGLCLSTRLSTGGGSAVGGGGEATGGGTAVGGGGEPVGGGGPMAGGGASGGGAAEGGGSALGGGDPSGGGSGTGGSASKGGGTASGGGATGGVPLPSVAPATIVLKGQTLERGVSGTTPLAGVSLTAFSRAGQILASAMSDGAGNFALQVQTNQHPVDGFIVASKAGYADTYSYPAVPWAADWTNTIDSITTSTAQGIAVALGYLYSAADAYVFVSVLDCEGLPVSGATVTSSPAAQHTLYVAGGIPNPSATATDSSGDVVLVNMPAGPFTLDGNANSTALRTNAATAVSGSLVEIQIQP